MRTIPRLLVCAFGTYIVVCACGAHMKSTSAIAIEFSAQREQQTKKIVPQQAPPVRVKPNLSAPQSVVPPRTRAPVPAPDHGAPAVPTPPVTGPKFVVPGETGTNASPAAAGATVTAPNITTPSIVPGGPSARVVTTSRLGGLPAVGQASIRGRSFSVWRNGYHAHFHRRRFTCVPLSALPAIWIAALEFYPFAYVEAPESYCDGLTEDGCQLVWQDVETEEGDTIPQCVAYCPWQQQ